MSVKIWTFWHGDKPPIINLCLQTLKKHCANFEVATMDTIKEIIGGQAAIDEFGELPIVFQSDLYRLLLLRETGGIWIDADSIAIRSIELDTIDPDADFMGVGFPNQQFPRATPFYVKQKSITLDRMIERVFYILRKRKSGANVGYDSASVGMMRDIIKTHPTFPKIYDEKTERIITIEHWKYNRIFWDKAREIFTSAQSPLDYEYNNQSYNPNIRLYHMTNLIINLYAHLTEEQLLKIPTFFAFLFQKGLQLPPTFPSVVKTLIAALPEGPVQGVVIGVNTGVTYRSLLLARQDIKLRVIDTWDKPSSYDDIKEVSKESHDRNIQRIINNNELIRDRAIIHCQSADLSAVMLRHEGPYDFIILGGDTDAEKIFVALDSWYSLLKLNGVIVGRNYDAEKFPEYVKEINAFTLSREAEVDIDVDSDNNFIIHTSLYVQ